MLNSILLIDDDKILTKIYSIKLMELGFTVRVAMDGQTALSMIDELTPDAIILDIMLPDMNGMDILEYLRKYTFTSQMPVLMFSASCSEELECQALNLGATCILDKSVMTPRILGDYLHGLLRLQPDPTHPSPVPSVISLPSLTDEDYQLQLEYQKIFSNRSPEWIKEINRYFQSNESMIEDKEKILGLAKSLSEISSNASLAGFIRPSRLAGITEKVLLDVAMGTIRPNLSLQRTIYQAIETITVLLKIKSDLNTGIFLPSILAVDDDALSRSLIHATVQKVDLNALVVADAQVAIELLEENDFSLILLDIMMPGIRGDDLCRRIRKIHRHILTPVIFITGVNNFVACTKILASGGNDLVCKPFSPFELSLKIMIYVLQYEFHDIFEAENQAKKKALIKPYSDNNPSSF